MKIGVARQLGVAGQRRRKFPGEEAELGIEGGAIAHRGTSERTETPAYLTLETSAARRFSR